MNLNTTLPDPYYRLRLIRYPLYTGYIIVGTPGVLTNLIILVVLACDKKLLKKSAMIAGLAGGNLLSGLHEFGYGVYRVPLLYSNSIELQASVWLCMASLFPTFMLLAYSLPAAMQFVIGLERLVAMGAFKWYSNYWSNKKSWLVVAAVYILMIVVWVIPLWYTNFSSYRMVTKECSSTTIVGLMTLNFMSVFVIVAGTAGVICVLAAVIIGRRRYKKLVENHSQQESQFKSQLRICRLMLVVASADFILVVVPHTLWLLRDYLPTEMAAMFGFCSTLIYCINSTTNVFIYLGMNGPFRRAAFATLKILIPCKCFKSSNVTTINAQ